MELSAILRLDKRILPSSVFRIVLIVCSILITVTNTVTLPHNKFVRKYEALHYDTAALEAKHQRSRRSISDISDISSVAQVHLDISAYDRKFRLRLFQDLETFGSSSTLEIDGKLVESDFSHIYHGYLEGEPSSYVHGSIIDGIFSGRIFVNSETYYIDKTHLHFAKKQPFHSFIYSSDDVLPLPYNSDHPAADDSSCGLRDSSVHEWMKKVQNSAKETPVKTKSALHFMDQGISYGRYSYGANSGRQKRETSSDRRLCSLLLQSDPKLWEYMKNRTAQSDAEVKNEITSLFALHVSGIKAIYSNTTFQYNEFGPFNGITFSVHRMRINTTDGCSDPNPSNPFCKPNIDVSNFLNLNSLTNHDDSCLAFVFTFRDFAQGTLGLAWVGSNLRTAGGICERFKLYIENGREVYKSLNTGIVTLSNYGSRVPTKVSLLTFAHEVGHGFGSPHDSGSDCVPMLNNPNNPLGNYIMYASATSGDKPNNQKFSKCSIGNMTLVLNAVLNGQNGKVNCFETSEQSFCGNRIVEPSEECDCGYADDCSDKSHPDNCCYPRDNANASRQCHRRPNASCSPSEGPCCLGDSCSFVSKASNKSCQAETECTFEASCNGSSAQCPAAEKKPDSTFCNAHTQICKNGECTGSVCEKISWSVCTIVAPADNKNFDRGQLCFVSCLNPATNSCVTTGNQQELQKPENKKLLELLQSMNLEKTGIQLPSGAPCDNYRGYCDVFRKCRSINEDGPLARLTNILFSQQALSTVRDWITVHWWAVLLMGVVFVVGLGLFIKVCAVHTPSSNPNRPAARKLKDLTLPRRSRSGQQTSLTDARPGQGPPAGKRRSQQPQGSSRQSSARRSRSQTDDIILRPPPHYENQLADDFDRI